MARLQNDKVQLAFCEVNLTLENLTLHFASKILISTWHCIVVTGITIKRNLYEGISNNKL